MPNQLTKTAIQLLAIESDFPFRVQKCESHLTVDDFEMHTFEQAWGSTALGFPGIGGSAITFARTYVFVPRTPDTQTCFVYFAGKFAYAVEYCEELMHDISTGNVASVFQSKKYIKDTKKEEKK